VRSCGPPHRSGIVGRLMQAVAFPAIGVLLAGSCHENGSIWKPLMTVLTGRPIPPSPERPLAVLLWSHSLQMEWVDAHDVSAQMVNIEPVWDWANEPRMRDPVRVQPTERGVALAINRAVPPPARTVNRDPLEEQA
jgi:hypothetical protein